MWILTESINMYCKGNLTFLLKLTSIKLIACNVIDSALTGLLSLNAAEIHGTLSFPWTTGRKWLEVQECRLAHGRNACLA